MFGPDTEALKRFYVRALGCEVEVEQPGGYVWLTLAGQELLLRPSPAREPLPDYQSSRVAFVLYVQDLAAARDAIVAADPGGQGKDGSDGCLTFADPAGNWFQVVEHD